MNLFSFLAISAPNDIWSKLINWIQGSVGNFGWTIILVTLLVKVVTTPLDFAVKLSTKKQTLVQQKCAPQVAKLQKKFGKDKQALQVQTSALYKREGLNMGAGCAIMLVNLILSCVIFFSFFDSLRKVSAYEAINQYEQVNSSYKAAYYNEMVNFDDSDQFVTVEDAIAWTEAYEKNKNAEEGTQEYTDYVQYFNDHQDLFVSATKAGVDSAVRTWDDVKKNSKWLWVQNIWVADSTAKPFPNYQGLVSMTSKTGYTDYVTENIAEADYNALANVIAESSSRSNNGFYILAVLAGAITFASQYITELHNKLKNKKANKLAKSASAEAGQSMKMMKIIMPLVMVIFVLSSSASFGLYILSSNVSAILLGELVTLGVDAITKKQRLEVEETLAKQADKLIKKGKLEE